MFESKIYNVGIYIRLSHENEDKRKIESKSILKNSSKTNKKKFSYRFA